MSLAYDDTAAVAAQKIFIDLSNVLGLELKSPEQGSSNADAFIELLLELRQDLRQQKLFDLSDKVRDKLANLGVVIEDTPQGSTWRWE